MQGEGRARVTVGRVEPEAKRGNGPRAAEMRTMTAEDLRAVALDALKQVAPEADLSALDPARNFRDQLEIDSVDYLNFVLDLEQRLGIRIPELHYPRLSSLNGCVTYLSSVAGGQSA